ncbi:hypothetical protein F01_230125 [Burkholderia cenocepacia]|nr:hypothetical protein F01_230125 [Burkholderia cenocepacia]
MVLEDGVEPPDMGQPRREPVTGCNAAEHESVAQPVPQRLLLVAWHGRAAACAEPRGRARLVCADRLAIAIQGLDVRATTADVARILIALNEAAGANCDVDIAVEVQWHILRRHRRTGVTERRRADRTEPAVLSEGRKRHQPGLLTAPMHDFEAGRFAFTGRVTEHLDSGRHRLIAQSVQPFLHLAE